MDYAPNQSCQIPAFKTSRGSNSGTKIRGFCQNSDLVRVLVQITVKIRTFSFDWHLWFFAKMLLFFYVLNQIFFFSLFYFSVRKHEEYSRGKNPRAADFFRTLFLIFGLVFANLFFVCAYFRSMHACDFVFKFLLLMKKMYSFFFCLAQIFETKSQARIERTSVRTFFWSFFALCLCFLFMLP